MAQKTLNVEQVHSVPHGLCGKGTPERMGVALDACGILQVLGHLLNSPSTESKQSFTPDPREIVGQ